MKNIKLFYKVLFAALISTSFFTCCEKSPPPLTEEEKTAKILDEYPVKYIELQGEAADKNAEFSGLAWFGNHLILLPQYPFNFSEGGKGNLFTISKRQIYDYLNSENQTPIEPEKIGFIADGLERFNQWGSGYEAIVFNQDTVYCLIESMDEISTVGYIVSGIIDNVNKIITLDSSSLKKIPSEINLFNFSDEAIVISGNNIIAIKESNGKNINVESKVSVFNKLLNSVQSLPITNIEYRITDATGIDNNNNFWAINYFYPGEYEQLKPAADSIIINFGVGRSHLKSPVVERLLEFHIGENEIYNTDKLPTYLKLNEGVDSRNWEGIVRLDSAGFLIITDRFPKTLFGFVAFKLN